MTITKKIKPKMQWLAARQQWVVYGHGSRVYHGSGTEAYKRWKLHQRSISRGNARWLPRDGDAA